nr:MAG TPA: Putative ATP dependent Clp protease [Caudoviricetes sp.]
MSSSKYWDLAVKENTSNEADLYLYNIIDDYAYEGYSDSADSILKDINDLGDIKQLNVFINSPGGSVFEGISIKNMLERQKLKGCFINVVIDGLAASIASVIAMAGDKISMPENALMMVHRASCGCFGNADEMRKQIEVLDKIDIVLTNTYVNRSGGLLSKEDVQAMFNSGDTWLTAEEAKNYGLCDEITESLKVAACAKSTDFENKIDLDKWSNKVNEWVDEGNHDNSVKEEKTSMENEIKPVNITVNIDAKAILDALQPIVDKITDLEEKLSTVDVVNKEVGQPIEDKVEDNSENIVEDTTENSIEAKVEDDKEEVKDVVEEKIENKVEEPFNFNPYAFDEFLKKIK